MKRLTLFALLFSIGLLSAHAQQFRIHQYRIADGLPSDFTKDITEDSLGYIWVATDYGLARLDGAGTSQLTKRGQFIKKFITTSKGAILVVGDDELLTVSSKPDTATFTTLAVGTQAPTDTTVWFPKDLFEDASGNIWLSEPQAISQYKDGRIKRYYFSKEDRTSIFVRSFSLFQSPNKDLYAVSYPGRLFRFNAQLDDFELMPLALPSGISAVRTSGNIVWLGTETGLYESTITAEGLSVPKKIFDAPLLSSLLVDHDKLWVGTYRGDVFLLQLQAGAKPTRILAMRFDVINNMYKSSVGDYWLATDKGVILLQPTTIEEIDNSTGLFVEAVSRDQTDGTIYYSVKEELYKLVPDKIGWRSQTLYSKPLGYFQGIAARKGTVWAANAFSVLHFENDRLKQQWDFSNRGQFVHDLWLDRTGQLWVCQDSNDSLLVIDKTKKVQTFHVPIKSGTNVVAAREGRTGMFAISNHPEAYLFFKRPDELTFRNISLPLNLSNNIDIGLTDLATQGDSVWLATGQGLLLYTGQSIKPFSMGVRYNGHALNVVEVFDRNRLIIGNAFGLFVYNIQTGEYWLYDENAGLPANTISPRNIAVDQSNRIWVGTSSGLVHLMNEIQVKVSPVPGIRSIHINGVHTPVQKKLRVPYEAFVSLAITAPIYPRGMTLLEWRLNKGEWNPVENFEISLPSLASGVAQVDVRALKTGLKFSPVYSMEILVGKPFWKSPWFMGLVLLALFFVTVITVWITQKIQRKRERMLESLIEERTFELNHRNQELDRFVYSASHDLSAPLRSILGLVNVFKMENPTPRQQEYLSLMEQSVHKLQSFINDVVNYSRNSRLPAKTESINFKELVASVLDDHRFSPDFDTIQFSIEDLTDGPVTLDSLRLKIVLNNLISNAIKFRWTGDDRISTVRIILEKIQTGGLKLSVADNGRGIQAQHLGKLFDMFYRATADAPGSGLGLYIVKESVKKMKGEITVQSTPGKGTTFTITLPA